MDQEEADIDLIERRLNGDLTDAELKAFDQRVAADLKFAEKVDDYVVIIKGIKNADSFAFSEEVAQWEKEISEEERGAGVVAINPWKKYMIAAAVTAVLLTTFVFINRPDEVNQKELFATYFVPYEDVLSVREETDSEAELAAAMSMYNEKMYRDAIPHFLKYLAISPQRDDVLFYLGISYLGDRKASDASSVLEQIETGGGAYSDHATWYLALADILKEDFTSAKTRLERIVSDPDHDFFAPAEELLDELH